MMNVTDAMDELNISRSKAYKIFKELNQELSKMGYKVIPGKVPRPFFEDKFYGYAVRRNE